MTTNIPFFYISSLDFHNFNIYTLLLDEVWQVLEATGFTDKYDSQIYLSVHDAVFAATVEGEGEYGNEASILVW